jgi:hypothetical protein
MWTRNTAKKTGWQSEIVVVRVVPIESRQRSQTRSRQTDEGKCAYQPGFMHAATMGANAVDPYAVNLVIAPAIVSGDRQKIDTMAKRDKFSSGSQRGLRSSATDRWKLVVDEQ